MALKSESSPLRPPGSPAHRAPYLALMELSAVVFVATIPVRSLSTTTETTSSIALQGEVRIDLDEQWLLATLRIHGLPDGLDDLSQGFFFLESPEARSIGRRDVGYKIAGNRIKFSSHRGMCFWGVIIGYVLVLSMLIPMGTTSSA